MKQCFSLFLVIFLFFMAPTAVLAGPLDPPTTIPHTGQTECYDVSGNVIACAGTGQDGEHADLNAMQYTILADGTVRDEVTGLIWEVKENKDDNPDYTNPSDADNTYTWYDPSDPDHVGTESNNDTQDFLSELKTKTGHNDWRIPSREELRSLVDYSIPEPGPTINRGYFPNTVSSDHWSSTTCSFSTDDAWRVGFSSGGECNYSGQSLWNRGKSASRYVRAVRGGQ